MILIGIKNNKIFKLLLPENVEGDYVIKDNSGTVIGNIVAENDKWILYPNQYYELYNGTNTSKIDKIEVIEHTQILIKNIIDGSTNILIITSNYEKDRLELVPKKNQITVGRTPNNDIVYQTPYISDEHAIITHNENTWFIECRENSYAFVDGRLAKRKRLNHGDVVFIYGLKIICISNYIILINCVKNNSLTYNNENFEIKKEIVQEVNPQSFYLESEEEVFKATEQFLRSPRFQTSSKLEKIKLSSPPESVQLSVQPTILTVGPQLTMMLTSVVSLLTILGNVANGTATLKSSISTIFLTVTMMISSLLWPALTRKWQKIDSRRKELKRIHRYRKYLEKRDREISEIIAKQKQILLENNVSLEQCRTIIYEKKRNLWERTIENDDFLTIRVGTGLVKPNIEISYDEQDFTMEDDILRKDAENLIKKYNYVEEVPVNISFLNNRISAIIGNFGILQSFFESLLLQIMTFHMYNELKIIVLTNENHVRDWDFIKFLPHCWDNQRERRFIASTNDEKNYISSYLDSIITEREEIINPSNQGNEDKPNEEAYKKFNVYYLIITDDIASSRNLEAVNKILNSKDNLGFSVIIKNDRIANLPNQCSTFINITDDISGMFRNDLNSEDQLKFKADFNKNIIVEDCVQKISNIYVPIPKEKHELPKSIGFMEMYGVGNVEQLNSAERWEKNNPVVSLSVPVGIDQNGELFNMDIHEKAYGPHGLVAGTTGSGKSEWIITYILSLCVNFSPLEVQFVLIDYKGGGLAGSFENKETGIKLPHLVGTITNLDKSEIRRSLASLEAESKRRQRMFNEAREKLNDSSMNIYKYQQYYRKGMLDEPLSHLFIISDEFAELKAQEPEFLNQLVSIARIGRSLGIHLILATQKPAGVVDEQMWSNSRFKVCLRVQDKADSQDMIKCDDAAYLKQTGAFYLQVGLNEFFGLGQSAYAGVKYKPTTVLKKNIETSLDLIGENGEIIDTVDYIQQEANESSKVHGEELLNIIMFLSELSNKQGLKPRKLWLDAIEEFIYVDQLKSKYQFNRENFQIKPIIGEYDNPYEQKQNLLQIYLNKSNVLISGLPGSGKEKLLQTMIYSIITNYTPQEVSIYICDFGAETLGMFAMAPHIGDTVYSNDKTKIENLARYVKKEIKNRRTKYRDYGGTYENYIKYSKQIENLIVVIINDVGFLKDTYGEVFENIEGILADSAKYGIIFVETALEYNVHKPKLMSTFETKYLLRVNQSEYENAFGPKARDINPKELKGRGLCEVNNQIYEFQTASICKEEMLQQSIKYICEKLKEAYKVKAKPIPKIPNAINMDVINQDNISVNNVCVGYSIASIEPVYFDLQKNYATLILGSKKQQLRNYGLVLNSQLEIVATCGTAVYLFDPDDTFKVEHYKNIKYVEAKEIVNTLNNLIIYINGERDKFNALEDKSLYSNEKRSLIVLYSVADIYKIYGEKNTELLVDAFDTARELKLFDFVLLDNNNDFKDIQRHKTIGHMFIDSNGVIISNIHDNQVTLDLSTRDIRVKETIPDRQGYIIQHGKAKLSQVLQYEGDEEEED